MLVAGVEAEKKPITNRRTHTDAFPYNAIPNVMRKDENCDNSLFSCISHHTFLVGCPRAITAEARSNCRKVSNSLPPASAHRIGQCPGQA